MISRGLIVYKEPVYFPDYYKAADSTAENMIDNKEERILKVFLNPAYDYCIIEYDLSLLDGKAVIGIAVVVWSTLMSHDSHYFYSSLSSNYHTPFGNAPVLIKMDLNGDGFNIYDHTLIDDSGKIIMPIFILDTTIFSSFLILKGL